MPIAIKRFDSHPQTPYSFEAKSVDAICLLVHMERLPGVKVNAKQSAIITDNFEGYFTYKNFQFVIDTPFVNVWVSCDDPSIPESVFAEIEEHAKNYRFVWPQQLLGKVIRYAFLPRTPL